MADIKRRREQNKEGLYYVDDTCIDCDACRWIAPETFQRVDQMSAVVQQPRSRPQKVDAARALLSCPTSSIGTKLPTPEVKDEIQNYPLPVDDEGKVFYCGFHSRKSFGAATYFIKTEAGNYLIDCPRFHPQLAKSLESHGGVHKILLTHQDDVADHHKFHKHFGAKRFIHEDENPSVAQHMEIKFQGQKAIEMEGGIKIIPVPGHTKGHVVFLFEDRYLFTGDHLTYSSTYNQLIGFRTACWYDWDIQIKSMEKLLQYQFEWVLPGHGRRYQNSHDMRDKLKTCIEWMIAKS